MQVSYKNGDMTLVDAKAVTPRHIKQAQDNPDATSYSFHKPGSTFQTRDGREYGVRQDGSWRALNKPRSRVKRLHAERNAVKG